MASGLQTPPTASAGPSSPNAPISIPQPVSQSLDSIVEDILSATDLVTLNQHLESFEAPHVRDVILSSKLAGDQDPLSILNFHNNTLGVLHIVCARLSSNAISPLPSLEILSKLCQEINPIQAFISPQRITHLGKGVIKVAEASNTPEAAIIPLRNLLARIAPSPSHLTPLHPLLLRLCVSTSQFSQAIPILQNPISEISLAHFPDLSYNDHLVYHYAGGMAWSAMRKWKEAEECFELVVCAPVAHHPAAIQLEALKKLTFVHLIAYGQLKPLPKYVHPNLLRLLRGTHYWSIAQAYPSRYADLVSLSKKEEAYFVNEKNLGLLRETINYALRWSIQRLTETYLTLSLAEIGRAIDISDIEAVRTLITRMVEEKEIDAQISADNTVTFSESVPVYTKAEVEAGLRSAQEQAALFEELDRQLMRSTQFLNKVVKSDWSMPEDDPYGNSRAWMEESVF